MVEDLNRLLSPSTSGVMERPNQFPALGIYTDDGHSLGRVFSDLPSDIAKLQVPLMGIGRIPQSRLQGFKVYSKREIHILQQSTHGIGRNSNACPFQLLGNFEGGFPRPFASTDRVSGGLVFHNLCDSVYDLGRFFSCDSRPAPGARIRSWGKSPLISSWRPRATVCGSIPKREAMCASPPWPSFKDSSPAYSRRWRSLSILQKRRTVALASSAARLGLATIKEAEGCFK